MGERGHCILQMAFNPHKFSIHTKGGFYQFQMADKETLLPTKDGVLRFGWTLAPGVEKTLQKIYRKIPKADQI